MNNKQSTVTLKVYDRYVAGLWDHKQYSQKRDSKTADGLYIIYVVKAVTFLAPRKTMI